MQSQKVVIIFFILFSRCGNYYIARIYIIYTHAAASQLCLLYLETRHASLQLLEHEAFRKFDHASTNHMSGFTTHFVPFFARSEHIKVVVIKLGSRTLSGNQKMQLSRCEEGINDEDAGCVIIESAVSCIIMRCWAPVHLILLSNGNKENGFRMSSCACQSSGSGLNAEF